MQAPVPRRFRGLTEATIIGVTVPVATAPLARLLGLALMERGRAGPGLLIPRCRCVHTVGMRFKLDLLFLDREGRVADLRRSVPPGRLVRCAAASGVLELPSPDSTDSTL